MYWQATEAQTFDMAAFLLRAGKPHLLKDADGATHPSDSEAALSMGKVAFAENCARCHSSKLPTPPAGADPGNCSSNYLDCWNRYWSWTQTADFKAQARAIVAQPDFLDNNFLSTDLRVPITLLQTNVCSSLATNAIEGNIGRNSLPRLTRVCRPSGPSPTTSHLPESKNLRNAGRRTGLSAASFAGEPLVHSPLSAEQLHRSVYAEPLRGGASRILSGVHRADALARWRDQDTLLHGKIPA